MIFHLALAADWASAEQAGEYRVSTLGRTLDEEGFIHAGADLEQVRGVARRFYHHVAEPLVLLTIDETRLGHPVRFEVPDGADEAFPHIYGPIPVAAVTSVLAYPPDQTSDRTFA
jgi:uncharacterized protein (DUF952 family)